MIICTVPVFCYKIGNCHRVEMVYCLPVLGHRPQTDTRKVLSLGDKTRQRITMCSRVQTKRLETLFKHFEEVTTS